MSTSLRILAASALFASSVTVLPGTADAAPIGDPLAIIKAVPNITQPVQWRGEVGVGALLRLPVELSGARSWAARWSLLMAQATMVLAITVHRPRLWHTVLL